jgi:hypothetical protein
MPYGFLFGSSISLQRLRSGIVPDFYVHTGFSVRLDVFSYINHYDHESFCLLFNLKLDRFR